MEAAILSTGPGDTSPEPVAYDPGRSSKSLCRPGISDALLQAAGVRAVPARDAQRLCGLSAAGLWLPYRNLNGDPIIDGDTPYGRLRLQDPLPDRKYHQRAGSGVHAYIPPNFRPEPNGDLAIIEGEFKALALTAAGVTAIGISGFYGARHKENEKVKLHPEVARIIDRVRPNRILFFGDSDTTLNAEFPFAALELAKLVKPLPLFLPRISLDKPKGIDDCRDEMGDGFDSFLKEIVSAALEVKTDMRAGDIALELLRREQENLKAGTLGMDAHKAQRRLVEIAAAHADRDPFVFSRISDLISSSIGIGKRALSAAIKAHQLAVRVERRKKAIAALPEAYNAVINQFGPPLANVRVNSETGQIVDAWPNEPFWAGLFEAENDVLFEPAEKQFYLYHPASGLWMPETSASLEQRISQRILTEARENPEHSFLEEKRTTTKLGSIRSQVEGIAERRDAFKRRRRLVHCANTMISFEGKGPEALPFAKEFYSRNGLPVPFDPNADCPRFRDELLLPAVTPEDALLIQRFFGLLVLQDNPAQRFLILDGDAGRGKTQLEIIAQKLVGAANWGELRTAQLDKQFELYRLARKSLLIGPDVAGDFLMQPGARRLKALVGGDAMEGEGKNSNEGIAVEGRFNVLLTCNERLRVRLEGDVGAWRRRLLIVRFEMPPPEKKIENFGEKLFEEEGAGILCWAMTGAADLLRELDETGDIILTPAQQKRIDDLLDESDSLPKFCRERICRSETNDLTKEEIVEAYGVYCSEQGWEPWPLQRTRSKLPEIMHRLFGSAETRSLVRHEKSAQGFRKVQFIQKGGEG